VARGGCGAIPPAAQQSYSTETVYPGKPRIVRHVPEQPLPGCVLRSVPISSLAPRSTPCVQRCSDAHPANM